MLALRFLKSEDKLSFDNAIQEFKESDPKWEFAFHYNKLGDFEDYVARTKKWSQGEDIPGGFVPNSYLVAVVGGKIVGRASIRHSLNDFLIKSGGHIGYGVVHSERGKGYAKEILRQSLAYLKTKNVEQALVTCHDDNIASIRVIEANGGELENVISDAGSDTRRYWIDLV